MKNYFKLMLLVGLVAFYSCNNDDAITFVIPEAENPDPEPEPAPVVALANHSVTPSFILPQPGFENLQSFSLFGSADRLPDTPNFRFGGSADGAGLLANADGTFSYIVNCENNFSVAKVTFDGTFRPVAGEYIYNSIGSDGTRLCSATLATPEIHGFGPLFLTAGESGEESVISGVDPNASSANNTAPQFLPALGRASWENAVPLPQTAYDGRTVILLGEDDTTSGRITMYESSLGDLEGGNVYVLVVLDSDGNPITAENELGEGETFDVRFERIENAINMTGAEQELAADGFSAMPFKRVEDLDYRKGAGNERTVFFNVTGSASSRNPNGTTQGRVYRLDLDSNSAFTGTLTCVIDGDDPNSILGGLVLQSPDNITVTENYAYIKEDPNGGINLSHYSYIWQYDIANNTIRPAVELDLESGLGDPNDPFGRENASFRSWEYGAMIDVSDVIGVADTFMVCIQTHTWREDRFINVDGGGMSSDNQGSQVVLIQGLPR
ncbi:hypothetical protein GTQ40_05855 [Flavobacteriaceae bacterium R38]|nr:hypothetical protein [Flavobacteriaceae bacterium R38]